MKPAKDVKPINDSVDSTVWFAYDGDCPICNVAAHALRIRKNIGPLYIVNAREQGQHPLLDEINERRLNLDEGMVLKFQERFYHGADALHMMALLGSGQGWFNKMNSILYRSTRLAAILYPLMRATRNFLLLLKGVGPLANLLTPPNLNLPIFSEVFGASWDHLPQVIKSHYAVRPDSIDVVVVEGSLDIQVSLLASLIAKIFGTLVPYSEKNVPVTVTFRSGHGESDGKSFYFDREFRYARHKKRHFRSRMVPLGGNELIEIMRFGIGWKLAYLWDGEKVILQHRGYVWCLGKRMLPIPLTWVLGRGYAEEHPTSDQSFSMFTYAQHPWFGKTFAYSGHFKITKCS